MECPVCSVGMTPSDMHMPSVLFGEEWWIKPAGAEARLVCASCAPTFATAARRQPSNANKPPP